MLFRLFPYWNIFWQKISWQKIFQLSRLSVYLRTQKQDDIMGNYTLRLELVYWMKPFTLWSFTLCSCPKCLRMCNFELENFSTVKHSFRSGQTVSVYRVDCRSTSEVCTPIESGRYTSTRWYSNVNVFTGTVSVVFWCVNWCFI